MGKMSCSPSHWCEFVAREGGTRGECIGYLDDKKGTSLYCASYKLGDSLFADHRARQLGNAALG